MFFFPLSKAGRERRAVARKLYTACVSQSLSPVFYAELGVPDTFDGRFDLTSLHVGLLINRLAQLEGNASRLAQAVFDEMFVNMDQTCREMGVGDLSIPKHIKRMMKALKGRAMTYQIALDQGEKALAEALLRNLYATAPSVGQDVLADMTSYVLRLEATLQDQGRILQEGRISFPVPFHEESKNHGATIAAA